MLRNVNVNNIIILRRQNRLDCQLLYRCTFLYSCFAASRSYVCRNIFRFVGYRTLLNIYAQASVPKVWSPISRTSQSLYKQYNVRH